jgi:hypothetical protein
MASGGGLSVCFAYKHVVSQWSSGIAKGQNVRWDLAWWVGCSNWRGTKIIICESDVVHKSLFFIAVPGDKLNVLLKYSLN